MENVEKYLSEMLNVTSVTDVVDPVMDTLGMISPLGSLWSSFKMHRLKKRLNKVEPELWRIKKKIETKENEVFYKQEVFPLILKALCEEDEEGKENIYINGFEYTVDKGIKEMEKVFHYFDVLAELRISDIVYLLQRYGPKDDDKPFKIKFGMDVERYHSDEAYKDEYKERQDLKRYTDNKFVRLGLVEVEQINHLEELNTTAFMYSSSRSTKRVPRRYLTNFGDRFIKFFAEDEQGAF